LGLPTTRMGIDIVSMTMWSSLSALRRFG